MRIRAHIKPNSKHVESITLTNDIYEIRVKAPAVEGKANIRTIELLATHFGVSRSRVKIIRGHTSKLKIVEIDT